MNSLRFSASLTVNRDQISGLKGDQYSTALSDKAEQYRSQIDGLPENITSVEILQETDTQQIPAKTSFMDLFVPVAIMRGLSGDYQGSTSTTVTENTIARIKGAGPRGGKHVLTMNIDPQSLPPKPVKKYLFGLIKVTQDRTEADYQSFEAQLTGFFEKLLSRAQEFSESKTLLGKKEFEKRQIEE